MLRFALKKLYVTVVTLLGVSVLAFVLIRVAPGDTVSAQLGLLYTEERAAAMRAELGLDRPLVVQYGRWLADAARGDLGRSFFHDRPVSAVIADRLAVTAQLAAMALAFAVVAGLPLGVLAAARRGRWVDGLCSSVGVLGVSVPAFWLATLLILLFAYVLRVMPSGGYVSPAEDPLANLRHMAMPAVALGSAVAAVVMRMTRSAMLEVLGADYVRTARSKGLPPARVTFRHALRNAMAPILTILAVQTGYLLGGSVVIEWVFDLPGLGWAAYRAATNRDYFLLQGVVLFIAAAFIVIHLALDLLYAAVDPRIRIG